MRLFFPVALAAHIIAASEPVPVFRAFRLFAYSRGGLVTSYTHNPSIYVASVGRNGLGSDCRIAFCFATGVIASDQTPHLVGWLFEGDPGVEPGNVART